MGKDQGKKPTGPSDDKGVTQFSFKELYSTVVGRAGYNPREYNQLTFGEAIAVANGFYAEQAQQQKNIITQAWITSAYVWARYQGELPELKTILDEIDNPESKAPETPKESEEELIEIAKSKGLRVSD